MASRFSELATCEDAPNAVTISKGQHQLPTILGIATSNVVTRLPLEAAVISAFEAGGGHEPPCHPAD